MEQVNNVVDGTDDTADTVTDTDAEIVDSGINADDDKDTSTDNNSLVSGIVNSGKCLMRKQVYRYRLTRDNVELTGDNGETVTVSHAKFAQMADVIQHGDDNEE